MAINYKNIVEYRIDFDLWTGYEERFEPAEDAVFVSVFVNEDTLEAREWFREVCLAAFDDDIRFDRYGMRPDLLSCNKFNPVWLYDQELFEEKLLIIRDELLVEFD